MSLQHDSISITSMKWRRPSTLPPSAPSGATSSRRTANEDARAREDADSATATKRPRWQQALPTPLSQDTLYLGQCRHPTPAPSHALVPARVTLRRQSRSPPRSRSLARPPPPPSRTLRLTTAKTPSSTPSGARGPALLAAYLIPYGSATLRCLASARPAP